MNREQSYLVHKVVEYIKSLVELGSEGGFHWADDDIENNLAEILACYDINIDAFSDEETAMIKEEFLQLAEKEEKREIVRIYAIA